MREARAPGLLLVTRNFPPLLGGMEKLNQRLLGALPSSWRLGLCGPAGAGAYAPAGAEVRECAVKPLPRFLAAAAGATLRAARRLRPDWVLAGSGLTAPLALLAARSVGARAAVYLHGLDVVVASRLYQALWLPCIRRCDLAFVNSANTAALAQARGVPAERIHVLHPGTDVPALDATAGAAFRRQHALGEGPVLLSVGRLTERKGLAELVAGAFPAILRARPDTVLATIGDEASDALHTRAGSERERILAAAQAAGVADRLRFLGRCSDADLSAAYQAADAHVFPVRDLPGDVEGFGMVALEAAAHGLPTVAFRVGGVPDAVRDGVTGALIAPGDYAAFGNAVVACLQRGRDAASVAACRDFAVGLSWEQFGARLRQCLEAPRHG